QENRTDKTAMSKEPRRTGGVTKEAGNALDGCQYFRRIERHLVLRAINYFDQCPRSRLQALQRSKAQTLRQRSIDLRNKLSLAQFVERIKVQKLVFSYDAHGERRTVLQQRHRMKSLAVAQTESCT